MYAPRVKDTLAITFMPQHYAKVNLVSMICRPPITVSNLVAPIVIKIGIRTVGRQNDKAA
jgi:hypothetical protein